MKEDYVQFNQYMRNIMIIITIILYFHRLRIIHYKELNHLAHETGITKGARIKGNGRNLHVHVER